MGINKGCSSFVICDDVDLKGTTVAFPIDTKIIFRDGSLKNGYLKGTFVFEGIASGTLSIGLTKGSIVKNRMPIYPNNPSTDASIISACKGGAELKGDIIVEDAVVLTSSIEGNGHYLRRTSNGNSTLFVENSTEKIFLHNLTIIKDFAAGTINQSYALYCVNSSNLSFSECNIIGRVYFVNNHQSDDIDKTSHNFSFEKCNFICDLTDSPQGAEYGQDHLTFCSIKDLSITNCSISSRNVNRVIKTTAYFPEDKYEKAVNCCDGIVFKDNEVTARSDFGKQFWDFFCGTVNVQVDNNTIDIEGFTEVFENKATQDKYKGNRLIESIIVFSNNTIRSKYSSLFQFCASPKCDNFVFDGNECHIYGTNRNPSSGFVRNSGSYLQGYKSCVIKNNKFYWEDEAIGMMFTTFNFDCLNTTIENNYFRDVYRVNAASSKRGSIARVNPVVKSFVYRNNKKEYTTSYRSPKIEVALEGVHADKVVIEVNQNNTDDFFVSLNTDAQIDYLSFSCPDNNGKAICILSDEVKLNELNLPVNSEKRGRNWYINKSDGK